MVMSCGGYVDLLYVCMIVFVCLKMRFDCGVGYVVIELIFCVLFLYDWWCGGGWWLCDGGLYWLCCFV